MAKTTNFPNGITNIAKSSDIGILGMPSPLKYVTYFSDFTGCEGTTVDLLATSPVAHTKTVTEAGAGSHSVTLSSSLGALGGALVLTNDAASADLISIQAKGEAFRFSATKDFIIKARFKVDSATLSSAFVGVAITDTTPLDASDRIGFQMASGSATLSGVAVKDSTSTTVGTKTMVSDTFVELALVYSASAKELVMFADGVKVGSTTTLTNVVNDEDLTMTLHIQNGSAVIRILTLDYILIAFER